MVEENTSTDHTQQQPSATYETRDANFKNLMIVGIGLIGVVGFVLLGAWLISALLTRESANPGVPAHIMTTVRPEFPAPRLQENPLLDLQQLRAHEDSVLSTYGWSDRKAGLVRVPIEQAMSLLLQKGLPVISEQVHTTRPVHGHVRARKEQQ